MEDKTMFKHLQLSATAAVSLLLILDPLLANAKEGSVTFDMVVSGGAKACLPNATGRVTITPAGPVEIMDVGRGHERFVGRFSIETFAVAPGSAPAPVVFNNGPF